MFELVDPLVDDLTVAVREKHDGPALFRLRAECRQKPRLDLAFARLHGHSLEPAHRTWRARTARAGGPETR